MNDESGLVAIRFGLYLCLMLLVGLAAFPLYVQHNDNRPACDFRWLNPTLLCLCGVATLLSLLGFLMLVAAMKGVSIVDIDWAASRSILLQTQIGTAWLVRMAALGGLLIWLVLSHRSHWSGDLMIVAAAAVALASLVWTGHAGATVGVLAVPHKISDMVHMIASAVWLGGMVGFLVLLRPASDTQGQNRLAVVHRALQAFARTGTICVVTIMATGLINATLLIGWPDIPVFTSAGYGRLLLLKLCLFALILVCAANNRWRLTPDLGIALAEGREAAAAEALRTSLWLELAAAIIILALVSWLGTLDPVGSAPLH